MHWETIVVPMQVLSQHFLSFCVAVQIRFSDLIKILLIVDHVKQRFFNEHVPNVLEHVEFSWVISICHQLSLWCEAPCRSHINDYPSGYRVTLGAKLWKNKSVRYGVTDISLASSFCHHFVIISKYFQLFWLQIYGDDLYG